MIRLKKGDEVIAISGKNKGRIGSIIDILYDRDCVIVEGLNIVKKHIKSNPNKGIEGGIVQKASPIHMSNLALYNINTKKPGRIGFKFLVNNGNKKKVRYFKSDGELLDSK